MGVGWRRRGYVAATAAAAAVVAFLAGCGGNVREPSDEPITLVVDIFSNQGFGYEELYTQYMKQHPNIRIKERGKGIDLQDYNVQLAKWISMGDGAGDIVALEEGTIVQFKNQASKFVNLLEYGGGALEPNFLQWKWREGQTADGARLIGLGTDIGSMAICYRRDLFAKAGLPTDRERVAELWRTWPEFIDVGKNFVAKQKSVRFVDTATNFYNTVLLQTAGANSGFTYFDNSDKLVIESNPDVRTAWNLTINLINSNLSASLRLNSEAWNNGFKQDSFATIACPAWMMGAIKANSGDALAGQWDVARPPGTGGNWGGSFLTIPTQSRHPKEAAELIKYLTGAEGQLEAFGKLGNLPSNQRALQDPFVLDFRNQYFNNAPTGQIFAAGAMSLKPVYFGPRNQAVRDEVENALRSVEQKQRTPDQAWQDAIANGTKAAKG